MSFNDLDKNSILDKITPCCALPFSVMYWFLENVTLLDNTDLNLRNYLVNSIQQNGVLKAEAWKVFAENVVLEPNAVITRSDLLIWLDGKKKPTCDQLRLIITESDFGNWTPPFNIPENIATVDMGVLIGNAYTKSETFSQSQINTALGLKLDKGTYTGTAQDLKNSIDGKLNKPTTTSNTASYPYVVGEDGNGNSARLPAGDLGKNFFNSDLSNTTARNHTMNAGVTVNTLGNPHTLAGLPNKNADITNFRKVRVQNTSGLDSVVDSKNLLTDGVTSMTDAEKTAFKTALNGGWSTGSMSIGMVYPNVVKYTDDIIYITIYGANLNLPPNSEIKIINIANNTEYVIPNSQVIYGDASKIYFWIKATDYVKAEYKIRIFNGAAIVDTQSNNNLLFVDVLNEIDITSVTWDKKSTTQSQVENVLATSSTTLHFETNDNNAPVNTGGIVASAKSSIIANANENFVFEARVEGKFSYQILGGFKFGLMNVDKENSLLNDLDLDFEMISTTPNWGSARILYDSSNYISYTDNYSNNNYGDGTFPVDIIISKKQNFITVTFIIPRIGVFVYSKMLSNTFGISLGFKGYNRNIGRNGNTTATADIILKRIYKF